jgi:hypothetical protein
MRKSISRHIIDVQGGFRIATTVIYYSDISKSRLPIPYPEKPQFDNLGDAMAALKRERGKVACSAKIFNLVQLSSCQFTFDMF